MTTHTGTKKGNKGRGIVATGALLILSKLKWLLAVLKFSKFGATFISLVVSLAGYAVFYGWRFGAALVYLLFVHEMGHLVAAKQKGIRTSPAVFIPFMGAVIGMKEQPKNAADEAYLAYGGPLAGLISILPAVGLFFLTQNQFWMLVMMLGALINLFNMIPVSPLDGGRIVSVLSTKIWLIGLVLIVVYAFISPSPIIILIAIFGFFAWWRRVRETFQRERITGEKAIEEAWEKELVDYKSNLFYTIRHDEDEETFLDTQMVLFSKTNDHRRIKEIDGKLERMRSFYLPFFEDKKKLEKAMYLLEKSKLKEKIVTISSFRTQEDVEIRLGEVRKVIKKLDSILNNLKSYYVASSSTKWKVFFAYIVLVLILAIVYLYSKDALNHVSHSPFMMN